MEDGAQNGNHLHRSKSPGNDRAAGPGARGEAPVERIVIVGAGDSGTVAARRLRSQGFGGAITLVGEEMDQPYERPQLSRAFLTGELTNPPLIATDRQLAEDGIDWVRGTRAVRLDVEHRTVTTSDDRRLHYDRLVLATGSRPRRVPVPGAADVLALRSAADAGILRNRLQPGTRLLIIGGGFIGLEIASSAVARGCAVVVVEFAHRLVSRVVPEAIADALGQRHRTEGVDLRLGVAVERIERSGDTYRVVLDDGAAVEADLVVAGIGAIPNTELAATAGLPIANGVAVNERLRTIDEAVYAIGDCCSVPHPLYDGRRVRLEAWRNALSQAEVAADNILGADLAYANVPSFWSDQYDLTMEVVGLHAAATAHVVRRRPDGHQVWFGLDGGGRIVSASGVAVGATLARDIRMAERLIAARATPDPADLSDASVDLRSLLP